MQLQRSCKERALYQTGGGGDQILTDFLKYLQKVDSFSCNFMTAFPNVQKRRCEGLSCNPFFCSMLMFGSWLNAAYCQVSYLWSFMCPNEIFTTKTRSRQLK